MNPVLVEPREGALAAVEADVTDTAQFAAAFKKAEEKFGPIDLLFNVAGGGRSGSILDLTLEDWAFCLALNMTSVFLGTSLAAQSLVAHKKRGAIVNVACINSMVSLHGGLGYAASKASAATVAKQAALELGSHSIRINTLSPGLVDTPQTAALQDIPAVRGAILARIPLARPARLEEIANAALFLASDKASSISGANLVVDAAWLTTGYPDLRNLS